jgi:hypothetical protein
VPAPNARPNEGDEIRRRCIEAKLKFHATGSKAPWRRPIEKLSMCEFEELMRSMTDDEAERLIRSEIASAFSDFDIRMLQHEARATSPKLWLAVTLFAHARWRLAEAEEDLDEARRENERLVESLSARREELEAEKALLRQEELDESSAPADWNGDEDAFD